MAGQRVRIVSSLERQDAEDTSSPNKLRECDPTGHIL